MTECVPSTCLSVALTHHGWILGKRYNALILWVRFRPIKTSPSTPTFLDTDGHLDPHNKCQPRGLERPYARTGPPIGLAFLSSETRSEPWESKTATRSYRNSSSGNPRCGLLAQTCGSGTSPTPSGSRRPYRPCTGSEISSHPHICQKGLPWRRESTSRHET